MLQMEVDTSETLEHQDHEETVQCVLFVLWEKSIGTPSKVGLSTRMSEIFDFQYGRSSHQ